MRLDIARGVLDNAALHPSHGQFLAIGLLAARSTLAIEGGYACLFSTGMAVGTHRRFFRACHSLASLEDLADLLTRPDDIRDRARLQALLAAG